MTQHFKKEVKRNKGPKALIDNVESKEKFDFRAGLGLGEPTIMYSANVQVRKLDGEIYLQIPYGWEKKLNIEVKDEDEFYSQPSIQVALIKEAWSKHFELYVKRQDSKKRKNANI
jgi:hypothetical protein